MSIPSDLAQKEVFRAQVLNDLQDSKIVNNLKAQFRYQLLQKLNGNKSDSIQTKSTKSLSSDMPTRMALSLIAEFLSLSNLNLTGAVFAPEIGNISLLFREDILDLLNFRTLKHSVDKSSISPKVPVLGYLSRLLVDQPPPKCFDSQTQTVSPMNMSIDDKLGSIESLYKDKLLRERSILEASFEEKLTKMRNRMQADFKLEMQTELTRIREIEMSHVRLEENEKWKIKFESFRDDVEKEYFAKLQKLKERENDLIEKTKSKMRELETTAFEHRQKVAKDLELLDLKEAEMRKRISNDRERIEIKKDAVCRQEKDISEKQNEVETQKTFLAEKLKIELETFKMDYRREYEDKVKLVDKKLRMLDEEVGRLEELKENLKSSEKQLKSTKDENHSLKMTVHDLTGTKNNLENEVRTLKEQIRTLSENIKRYDGSATSYEVRISSLQEQNSSMRTTVDEYKRLYQELRTSGEAQRMRAEQERDNHKKMAEEAVANMEKAKKEKEHFKRLYDDLRFEMDRMTMMRNSAFAPLGSGLQVTGGKGQTNGTNSSSSGLNEPNLFKSGISLGYETLLKDMELLRKETRKFETYDDFEENERETKRQTVTMPRPPTLETPATVHYTEEVKQKIQQNIKNMEKDKDLFNPSERKKEFGGLKGRTEESGGGFPSIAGNKRREETSQRSSLGKPVEEAHVDVLKSSSSGEGFDFRKKLVLKVDEGKRSPTKEENEYEEDFEEIEDLA